jgi:hypothetical protein
MAFHNTYNKERVVEEYKKRFQQILEYTSAGGFDLSEADDEQAEEQPMEGDPNAMGGEQMPDMGGEQPMGGDMQDPNMMGGDPNAMGGDMQDPNAQGGGEDLTSGFNPEGGDMQDPNMMGGGPNAMGGMDTMQPDDEVVDITELTDAQEATQEELESFDSKFTKAIKAIEKIEAMINTNNKNIADKISEIEVEMKKRNPTPMEKLSNRAANSYPFNVSPKEYWDEKEKNSNYSADDDNNGKGQEQYTITVGDINNANDWKTISDSLDDDLLYNQTLNNILKF